MRLTIKSLIILLAAMPLLIGPRLSAQERPQNQRWLFPITTDKGTGFIDQTGRVVIEPGFSGSMYGLRFSDGLAPVRIGETWGYIDTKGKVAFKVPGASWANDFTEGGLAGASINVKSSESGEEIPKWGFIDKTGKWVIKPQFDEQYGFSEGMGRVVVNGLWGFIDRTGKFVVEPQFKSAYWFSEGFALVVLANDHCVFIDHTGRIASPSEYGYTSSWFSEGVAPVWVNGKWGYINTKWQIAVEPKFDYVAQTFSDGVAAVKVGDLYGVIDKSGKFVIEPKFQEGLSFHEGLAQVRMDGKYGYIDKTGALVIAPQYESAGDFRGGLASVTRNPGIHTVQCCWHYWDYIDKTGKVVWKSPER